MTVKPKRRRNDGVVREFDEGVALWRQTEHWKKWLRRDVHGDERKVYFIESESGHIKIGMSENPEWRLVVLQRDSKHNLTLLGICDGGFRKEQSLHKEFADNRTTGEWFVPDERLWATIEELTGYQRVPICVQSGEYVPRWFGR